jgi:xanthine dehydrogenase/oxidase
MKQVTGEAKYTDDIPRFHNELYGVMVLSTKAHAKLKKVDYEPALELPGVRFWVDHNDLPNPQANWWGAPAIDGNSNLLPAPY